MADKNILQVYRPSQKRCRVSDGISSCLTVAALPNQLPHIRELDAGLSVRACAARSACIL